MIQIGIDIDHHIRIIHLDKARAIKANYLRYAGWNPRGGDTLILVIPDTMENIPVQLNQTNEWGGQPRQRNRVYDLDAKSPTLNCSVECKVIQNTRIRKLTPTECKRLQTIPEWYDMDCVSYSAQYKALGNGWNVETIKHIFTYLFK